MKAPTGGVSRIRPRNQGRLKKAAETERRRAAHEGRPASAAGVLSALPLDLGPFLLPSRVVHAVVLAVAAVGDGRFPEPDAVEVRRPPVGGVLRATAPLD